MGATRGKDVQGQFVQQATTPCKAILCRLNGKNITQKKLNAMPRCGALAFRNVCVFLCMCVLQFV